MSFNFFAMDSIELSSILDCFGDQITIKSTKTYTIWLEMIGKVLNMLIELKGNNYYSKVFKRVNYKLSNRTFWVVITPCEIFASQEEFHKPCETDEFRNLTKSSWYFCTNSVRFLFEDILCNSLFSPCNQLKIFLDI